MPVAVHCPKCGQELVAPDELIGQVAACPGCNTQFPISDESNGRSAATPPPPPPGQSTTGSQQAAINGEPPASANRSTQSLPTNEAYFPPGKAPPAKTPPANTKSSVSSPPPASSTQSSPRPKPVPGPASSNSRAAKPAKFIAGESTDTAIELGQDGQLPMLVLAEGRVSEAQDADAQKSNPLILVGVLAFSLLASLSMLLLDPTTYRDESDNKKDARAQIQMHYVKGDPLRESYQELLASALQAHNKGDRKEERKYYDQVLKMLREENKNEYTGLTGRVSSPSPPNDDHLDSQLRILLR